MCGHQHYLKKASKQKPKPTKQTKNKKLEALRLPE